jgi:sugar phosphate isomerase/epimerase
MDTLSRREWLRGAAGAAAFSLLPRFREAHGQGDPAYAGFNMGMQTYTLRDFDFDQTLAHLKNLGLRYAQFFGKQLPMTSDPAKIQAARDKLKAAGVQILSWGVQRFTKDAEKTKEAFEFARAMGFPVYSASPQPDSFDSLSSLTKEYGIKIAIHNHGPEDKMYGHLAQLEKAVEKYPVEIGACVDTGHVLRIGEDPVSWIRALGPRVHDVHLKDFAGPKDQDERTLGKGKLDVLGVLRALREVKFSGILALEYEKNGPALMDDIKECLSAVREASKKL